MKFQLLLIFSCWSICCCSDRTTNKESSSDISATSANLPESADTAIIRVNTNFPFGCEGLRKLEYPKHWEGDLENYGHLKNPGGQEFEDIGKCFGVINSASTINSPNVHKVELLEIGNIFRNASNADTTLQKSIDSCRYRLPDMGIYECYYSFRRYGNLLLFDRKTNHGKLLNIYADDLGGESQTILRYFYIDKNQINIYEAVYYDDGCTLDEKYRIIINPDGGIVINTIRN